MKISAASIASIALLASSADLVLARNDRVLKSSKAGGRGKGNKNIVRHDFSSLYRLMINSLTRSFFFILFSFQAVPGLPVALDLH